ncbi:tetratricopeptide repeat protein [Aurantiacibacter sp. D1-12]|uniref:tetratricopeptide repeat protein n=1 Tax=Aurantiacibacter sp. D1-12 TaxID=2993658 RepID=UPI00237C562F|nr:tetratricopeptide repeat protein [Aurantiacibacter sp. D1-12]MDE1466680.1 tetratricopeptide repeat protein [Aurantiacibacter sp. D1-12]
MKRILLPLALMAGLLGGCSVFGSDPMEEAREALAEQDYFAARDHALAALQDEAGNIDALSLLAQIQLTMGQGGEALLTLDRLDEAGASSDEITRIRAEALLQTGDFARAFSILGNDLSAEAWRLRALAAAMAGNDEEAAQHFLAGREAEGDKRKLFTAAASFHLARDDADAARYAVGQAQQLAPDTVETYFVSARLAELDGRPDLASRAYLAILERTPNDRPALLGAIRELDKLGRIDVFAPLIARGREAYPTDLEFIYLDASLMAYEGNWAGARDLLQQRESDIADYDDARGLYGQALLELGQFEQARAQIAPLNRGDPNNAAYARVFTRILLELGEFAQARRVIAPILRGPDAAEIDQELAERAANG